VPSANRIALARASRDEAVMRVTFVCVSLISGAAFAVALAMGCSSSSSSSGASTADSGSGSVDACTPIDSACGQPCDPGNSLGIGRFCNYTGDCAGTQIQTICATLGDPSEHFCTALCNPPDAGDAGEYLASCGANATCQCQGGQCGCYPTTCK
jgi:hypothetical protein